MFSIIFDMDGVLCDSQPAHFEADRRTLRKCGVKFEHDDVVRYAGMSSRDRWTKYIKDFKIDKSVDEMIEIHKDSASDIIYDYDLKATDNSEEFLSILKERGIKFVLASSSSKKFINDLLTKIGLVHYFDNIVSGETVERGKPNPDIFLKAAKALGENPKNCIVIEDSKNGVKAAKAASMKCIGYKNPTSGEQDISAADMIISNFCELLNLEIVENL